MAIGADFACSSTNYSVHFSLFAARLFIPSVCPISLLPSALSSAPSRAPAVPRTPPWAVPWAPSASSGWQSLYQAGCTASRSGSSLSLKSSSRTFLRARLTLDGLGLKVDLTVLFHDWFRTCLCWDTSCWCCSSRNSKSGWQPLRETLTMPCPSGWNLALWVWLGSSLASPEGGAWNCENCE